MRFLRKNQDDGVQEAGWLVPAEVAQAASAGYVAIGFETPSEDISSTLPKLLGLSGERYTLDALLRELEGLAAESFPALKRAFDELRQGRALPPFTLTLTNGRALKVVPYVSVRENGAPHTAGVWCYDVGDAAAELSRLRAENQALKGEMRHYANMLNMAPYAVWMRDKELNVRYYNLAYGEIVEDFETGSSGMPEMDKRERLLASQALQYNEPKFERRHLIVAGRRHLYQFSEMPVPEEQAVIGYAQDVSELEVMKEELDRHVSAQADLLESSASAMAIYGADMRLQSFNYAFVNLWKLDEAWLSAKPSYGEILEALREGRKLPEQANFQAFKQQQLKLFTALIDPREEFFYLPDGKTLRVIAIPHALGGILFAYEDVTDRLALERSYNTLIAVQRETLDNLHESVGVYGEDGRLKLYNPGYLQMWNVPEEFAKQGPHVRELVERAKPLYLYEDWEAFKATRVEAVQSRSPVRQRIERSDGKIIDASTVPLPDGATLVNYIDITDSMLVERSLRERNEALQEADQLKTQFLANVSYELRSPLTTIAGFSDMLRQQYFGSLNDKQRDYVEGIHTASNHLMQLVNDILDLASIEAGFMQLTVTRFDVAAMVKAVLSLVQERAKQQLVKLELQVDEAIGDMAGDEVRIKQCLFNLLSNAIRFSDPGGRVMLGAKLEGERVVLWVEDNGPGIPTDEQPLVFGKFTKGSGQHISKTKTKDGTGLGLAIVKNFVELHGGAVELESVPDECTRFTCRLPRYYEARKA